MEPANDEPRRVSPREGYDEWAEFYDRDGNPILELEEPRVAEALGDVRGLDVADVGCGTGRHACRLALAGARVTALDFSAGMMARAREKPGAERIRFVEHDLTRPFPLDTAAFDRVLSALVVEHIPDLAPYFSELRRICRREGFVVVSAMHPAMWLRGVSARFRDPSGREVRPRSHDHSISDLVMAALAAELGLAAMSEHAVDASLAARVPRAARYVGWPMLLVLKLRAEAR